MRFSRLIFLVCCIGCCIFLFINNIFAVSPEDLKSEFKSLKFKIKNIEDQGEEIPKDIFELIHNAKKAYKEGDIDKAFSFLKQAEAILDKINTKNVTKNIISSTKHKKDLLFFDFHYRLALKRPYLFTNHELLDGVIIIVPWSVVEPSPDNYDFSKIDNLVNIWYKAGKSVVLRIITYGQKGGNKVTPKWVFEKVSYIEFHSKKRGVVRIPKVWDNKFLEIYSHYIKKLSEHYNDDPKVKYIEIGIGHIGYLTAQPAPEAVDAFLNAGWNLKIWEDYVKKVIDLYCKYFTQKRLILTVTPLFIRSYYVKDHIQVAEDIIQYAVMNHYYILFKGISEDYNEFVNTGFPKLVKFLASLDVKDLRLGFGDDWPLIGPTGKKIRDENDFKNALNLVYNLWIDIDKKYSFFFVFLDNELAVTDKNNKHYKETVYTFLKNYLEKFK